MKTQGKITRKKSQVTSTESATNAMKSNQYFSLTLPGEDNKKGKRKQEVFISTKYFLRTKCEEIQNGKSADERYKKTQPELMKGVAHEVRVPLPPSLHTRRGKSSQPETSLEKKQLLLYVISRRLILKTGVRNYRQSVPKEGEEKKGTENKIKENNRELRES